MIVILLLQLSSLTTFALQVHRVYFIMKFFCAIGISTYLTFLKSEARGSIRIDITKIMNALIDTFDWEKQTIR